MPRARKESKPLNINLSVRLWNAMQKHTDETGVPKTVIVEKALERYLPDYGDDLPEATGTVGVCDEAVHDENMFACLDLPSCPEEPEEEFLPFEKAEEIIREFIELSLAGGMEQDALEMIVSAELAERGISCAPEDIVESVSLALQTVESRFGDRRKFEKMLINDAKVFCAVFVDGHCNYYNLAFHNRLAMVNFKRMRSDMRLVREIGDGHPVISMDGTVHRVRLESGPFVDIFEDNAGILAGYVG